MLKYYFLGCQNFLFIWSASISVAISGSESFMSLVLADYIVSYQFLPKYFMINNTLWINNGWDITSSELIMVLNILYGILNVD